MLWGEVQKSLGSACFLPRSSFAQVLANAGEVHGRAGGRGAHSRRRGSRNSPKNAARLPDLAKRVVLIQRQFFYTFLIAFAYIVLP